MKIIMVNMILAVEYMDIVPLVLLSLFVGALGVFIWWQVKYGRKLKSELELLKQMRSHNVEYEFVLEAMRLSIWHLDTKTQELTFEQDFRDKNERFVIVDGLQLDDSVSKLDPRDAERVGKSMASLCQGRTNYYHETYRVLVPYTNSFYWEESYATVAERDTEGVPTKIVGTTMRIDERKAMEEALVQARNRAEESDRLKTAFIANMSHEIRTPLNAIVGFTSVLPDIEDTAERQALLELINENTQKLLRIVDDVVNISKVESGQEELTMTAFDLNTLLQDYVERTRSEINPNVKLTTQFAAESLIITSDFGRLEQVVKHLLSNAAKFTTQGTIIVGYEMPVDGRVTFWVSDTGKGIPEEYHERVFERFFKIDEFIPGAGLGLSICRTMAFSLGGNITLESTSGIGSTFKVDIPVK